MKLGFVDQVKVVANSAKRALVSDGCTGAPDLDFGHDCCREHDHDYKLGMISRWEADKKLYRCIRAKGYVVLPLIYWLAVRIFGRGFYYGEHYGTDDL